MSKRIVFDDGSAINVLPQYTTTTVLPSWASAFEHTHTLLVVYTIYHMVPKGTHLWEVGGDCSTLICGNSHFLFAKVVYTILLYIIP